MAVVIALPKSRTAISLADWMEVNAFLDDADHSSSIEDVISQLNISNEVSESLKTDVSSELVFRGKKLDNAYPFKFDGRLLEIKNPKNYDGQWAYIFCLMLSYVGVDNGVSKLKVWKKGKITTLFEKVSGLAAQNFLSHKDQDSKLLYFGHPRDSWKKAERPFRTALKLLKSQLSEGDVRKMANDYRQKDAGLDILVWRNFPDQKTGKPILLGQCAAGIDYKSKRYEIRKFKNFFEIRSPYSQGLFVPHELDNDEWAEFCFDNDVGYTFDRGRIGWYAKDWDGEGFKSTFPQITKKLKTYKKAL